MKGLLSCWSGLLYLALLVQPAFGEETVAISATELIQRGRAELASNNWDAAESLFRLATETEPTNSSAYTWQGYTLAGLNRRQEAAVAYEKALELNPQRTNTWLYLGEVYYSLGRYVKGVGAYQKYISLNPRNDQAYNGLYRSLERLGRYGEAEKACRQAIVINPTNVSYYVGLGYCLENLGRYSEAGKIFEKALSLDPQNPHAYYRLGINHYHEKAYQAAISSLQKSISLQPTNSDGNYWLGRSFAALNRYDEAAGAFQQAIRIDPEDIQAYEWRGVSLLRIGQFDEAAATFEKAFGVRGEDKTVRRSLFCCYLLSSQYEKAYRLYPIIFTLGGSALLLSYLIGLTALLRSSFKISTDTFPRLGFSFAWMIVFFQGQIALIFCLALLSWIKISENLLFGITLAGIPVIFAAMRGFARQPWGQPFSWPLRLGTLKVMGLSVLGLVLASGISPWSAHWVERVLRRPVTIQEAIPLIKYALIANPLAAFSSVVIVGPIVEEILFRGLIYGALEKRLRVTGAILVSSLLFAAVHLQVVYFIPIFCLGLVLGWARWKANSLGLPILIHVLNNGVALLFLKFFEKP
ncbi:MAG TPA: tetratricopeptide repeat protein [Verrucomicrobiae bacterium]|nr:tetratricopeptide repeat protein [Verrucomicrobiae bacterium]